MLSDSCPYPKPFPLGFDQCPAFTPSTYTAFDLRYQPRAPVATCIHLVIGEVPGHAGAYYPRCGLGTAAERVAWVEQVSAERLASLRRLSGEYREWSRSRMGPLWQTKGRMLAARHRGDAAEARQAAHDLEAGVAELLSGAEAFVDARSAECEALDLPVEAVKDLIRLATRDWAWRSSMTSGYQVPDEVLERFPEPIRLFLTSSRTAAAPR